MEHELTLAEVVRALRRRRYLVASVTMIGAGLAGLAAALWPAVYSATARVLVERPQIASELAPSTVTDSTAERLQLIEERLMSRASLLEMAERLALFADRPSLTATERVEAMRQATRIQPIKEPSQARRGAASVLAFTIGFSAGRPEQAALVANDFVARLLEQNTRQRTARASETHAFFREEVARLRTGLTEAEQQVAAFKRGNEAALPESLEFRQKELADLRTRLADRVERRMALTNELADLREGPQEAATATPEARELADLRQRLAERRAVLSDRHPEIRVLSARIRAVEGVAAGSGAPRERQVGRLEAQLAALDEQDRQDRVREDVLLASIETTPKVEMALAAHYRRLEDLRARHQIAVRKQAEAEIGERLELNSQAERFDVIEQATPPERPDSPDRQLIALVGTAGSAALGLTLALLVEFSGNAIRDAADLERRLGIGALVVVPTIAKPSRGWRRHELAASAALVVLIAASVQERPDGHPIFSGVEGLVPVHGAGSAA